MRIKQIRIKHSPLGLRLKIASGYLLLIMLFGVIVRVVWMEKQNITMLNAGERTMQERQKAVNRTFEQLLVLSFSDDFLLPGDSAAMTEYHTSRLAATATLGNLKKYYPHAGQQSRIDTVCLLLQEKETHLYKLLETFAAYGETNELIKERIPTIVSQAQREGATSRVKKKGGFLGLFRKSQPIAEPLKTTDMLYSLGREVDYKQREQQRQLEVYADSLQRRNIRLNGWISRIIRDFESDASRRIEEEHAEIVSQRERSFRIISLAAVMAILLVIVFYSVIHRDITQKSIYRRKLESSDRRNRSLLKARNRMMLAMSHELRAPLTSIQGYAELLPAERKKENRLRYAGAILQSSDHMLALLNTLLNFYRLDVGKEQADIEPFSPRSVAEALETAYSLKAGKKGLFFTAEYEGDDLLLSGDKGRIMQIGGNLLSNAIKYTAAGEVALRVCYGNGVFRMEVCDTGTGMSEEEKRRIFEPFERLGNADVQEGFGMGLTITAGLVRLLQGKIRVESEPGRGTVFSVELPMPVTDGNRAHDEQGAADISLPKYLRVAVVDNDAVLLAMTVDMFAAHHIHCDGCHHAGELMELLRRQPYDLLVTDINMPGMNGFQLLELLRASNVGNAREIPVLVATACTQRTPEEFAAAGFAGCLYKPYSRKELFAAVRGCLPVPTGQLHMEADFTRLLSGEHDGKEMLSLLAEETKKDMARLTDAANRGDTGLVRLLVHHLSPLWEMVQTDAVLQELRNVCSEASATDKEIRDAVAGVVAVGEQMARQAFETIKKNGYE